MMTLLEQPRMDGITIKFSETENKFLFDGNMPNGQRHFVDREQIGRARRKLEDSLRKDPVKVLLVLDKLGMICTDVFK